MRFRLVAAALALGTLAATGLQATPVRPDVRKLVFEPQVDPPQFGPARAGWQGPEIPAAAQPNPLLDSVIGSAHAQTMRTTLLSALVPDRRAVLVVLAAILVLRRWKQRSTGQKLTSSSPAAEERPLAA